MSAAGTPWPSSSPARRLRLPSATTVATRSPAPARPANVFGLAPWVRANASTSAKTLPAAAPAAFGPLTPATAAASAAAFFAVPASSTPATSLVLEASKPAVRSRRCSCEAKTLSTDPTTSEAPWSSASAAWPGPPMHATARALTRSETYALGSVPSGATRPFESTSTPARSGIVCGVRVDGVGQRGGGDGEADDVGAIERQPPSGRDADAVGQAHVGQVVVVDARLRRA